MARIRLLFVLCLLLVATACAKREASNSAVAPASKEVTARTSSRTSALEIRVDLAMDVASAEDAARLARAVTERATAAGGYAESSSVTSRGSHLVLRVPPAALDDARAVLAAEGPLARETRTSRDVTDAVMDLDARVKTAKIEESRLLELLKDKAGNLADVLAVERALAEVRERIERLETEQRAAHARVDLAVLAIDLNVRGAFDGLPIGQQLVAAGREGLAFARTAVVLAATTTLRAGPTLLLLGLLAFGALRIARRVRQAG